MIPERHDTVKQGPNANQGGSRTSSSYSSQRWRHVGWFFAATVLASFLLNEIWEMAQMSAYVETAGESWKSTLGLCTLAAVGDVGISLGVYAASALAAGDLYWGLSGHWSHYSIAAVLGLVSASLVEHAALAAGWWSYTERMPVVSLLGAGVWPLIQMTLLPPLTFLLARWWANGRATKGDS